MSAAVQDANRLLNGSATRRTVTVSRGPAAARRTDCPNSALGARPFARRGETWHSHGHCWTQARSSSRESNPAMNAIIAVLCLGSDPSGLGVGARPQLSDQAMEFSVAMDRPSVRQAFSRPERWDLILCRSTAYYDLGIDRWLAETVGTSQTEMPAPRSNWRRSPTSPRSLASASCPRQASSSTARWSKPAASRPGPVTRLGTRTARASRRP